MSPRTDISLFLKRTDEGGEHLMGTVIRLHDSHFLLLLNLLLLFLVVLHDLQPLSLDQATLLDVELLLSLQVETGFSFVTWNLFASFI